MGVPKSVDYWVDIFTTILTGMATGIMKSEEIEEGPADYIHPETGKEVEATAYRARTSMEGKEVMEWVRKIGGYDDLKELLKDPKFRELPMYNPSIQLTMYFFPSELYDLEFSKKGVEDAVEGSHGWTPASIRLAKLGGDNVVFTGQEFTFTVYCPKSWIDEDKFNAETFRNMLKVTVSHELTHAYEGYHRFKRKNDPFMGRESFLNAAVKLMKDDKYPQWRQFLNLVYLHLSFEINARITQLYYEMQNKGVSTKEEFMDVLKKSSVWREIELLQNFNAEEFIRSFTVKGNGKDFFAMMDDLGKQVERKQRGLPPILTKSSPQEGMTHLISGWNQTLQILNKDFSKNGMYQGKLMDLVPDKALKDPMVFFKFFEKRFHKKAENFKRKAYRIASLVLDEKNEEKLDK